MTRIALALAALAVVAPSIAMAADPLAPPVNATTFDWKRAYVGVGVKAATLSDGGPQELHGIVNVTIGANALLGDKFVVGVEATAGAHIISTGITGFNAEIEGRAGVLVDPSVLVYGTLGGVFYDAGARYGTIGFGAEFAVTDKLSVDFDYQYYAISNNGFAGHGIGVSANWAL